ncbi:MAG: hypothetical protein Q8922_02420 [Bacteroidota bacterium]|nr:hypothetical protein [Bacteroidota bacterium]MDP4232270.1 hypothetical protein [Bacteroidota bacterium]MDP4242671.1 hypothetical protein [Bacteroidota bacterium]MDP4286767.1 hypothetical protein [Bacteroidota bacterium]
MRNINGLCYMHTPMYIGTDTTDRWPNFTDFASVYPDIGDGKTWMLAVGGPALFKEAFVSTDWPDYVFDSGYPLRPLDDFARYIETNHHLPAIPSAYAMSTGVPLGRTEAAITKQVEEMALYIVELNKQVEALKRDIQDLKKGGK